MNSKHVILVLPSPPWDENLDGVTKIAHNLIKYSEETKYTVIYLNVNRPAPPDVLGKREGLSKNIVELWEIKEKTCSRFERFFHNLFCEGLANGHIAMSTRIKLLNLLREKISPGTTIHFVTTKFVTLLKHDFPAKQVVMSLVDNNLIYLARKRGRQTNPIKQAWTSFQIYKTRALYDRYVIAAPETVWHFVSDSDAKAFASERGCRSIAIENGVDTQIFGAGQQVALDKETILFHGNMAYHPNRDACKYISDLARQFDDLRFSIFGRNSELITSTLPNVAVLGEVANVADHLQFGAIYFAPLSFGAGIKNKILEAMACGMCVVTTDIGIEGINPPSGSVIIVSLNNVDEIHKKLRSLISDDKQRLWRAHLAQRFVNENFGWAGKVRSYESIYR